jgi:glutaredoxin
MKIYKIKNMDFKEPLKTGFTIYSKSGCINCNKVKLLLELKNIVFDVIDCDEYILEKREIFLLFIKEISGKEIATFPIVFYDEKYIGGYSETFKFVTKQIVSFEENLDF